MNWCFRSSFRNNFRLECKHKVMGRDIPRTSRRISGRTSRPKNFHPITRSAGKYSFCLRGHPWPEGADVHDPRGSWKNFLQENFGLTFRFLKGARSQGLVLRWSKRGGSWVPFIRSQKGPTKPKNRTNSTNEFSEQFEGVTGHYPSKQGFWGKSHQKVHPNVRPNICHIVSLWCLFLSPINTQRPPECPTTFKLDPSASTLPRAHPLKRQNQKIVRHRF